MSGSHHLAQRSLKGPMRNRHRGKLEERRATLRTPSMDGKGEESAVWGEMYIYRSTSGPAQITHLHSNRTRTSDMYRSLYSLINRPRLRSLNPTNFPPHVAQSYFLECILSSWTSLCSTGIRLGRWRITLRLRRCFYVSSEYTRPWLISSQMSIWMYSANGQTYHCYNSTDSHGWPGVINFLNQHGPQRAYTLPHRRRRTDSAISQMQTPEGRASAKATDWHTGIRHTVDDTLIVRQQVLRQRREYLRKEGMGRTSTKSTTD